MLGLLAVCFGIHTACYAAQTIIAEKVDEPPVIDGKDNDAVWATTQAIVTHDTVANIDMMLKAIYTHKEIFFLVSFPDPDESRMHKAWVWDKDMEIYKQGPTREDCFVFKWSMMSKPVDLSIYSDEPYAADIWLWKACRTDPAGFADDKIDRLYLDNLPDSRKLTSKSGKTMYLQRLGDEGTEAYKNTLFVEYQGDNLPHFESQTPAGSRADIRAKGVWSDGTWTIEFGRALTTGNEDDIQFEPDKSYQFGVSRYEIAGREPEPNASQPLFGCGDISEELTLRFGQ